LVGSGFAGSWKPILRFWIDRQQHIFNVLRMGCCCVFSP
jgi:hypothetical protein